MPTSQMLDVYTARFKAEFWKAWNATAEPAPWEAFTQVVPSTTRIEHYPYFTPIPQVSLWQGYRNYGSVSSKIYSLQNYPYHTEFQSTLEDFDDEQTGALAMKPKELVEKCKLFPGRQTLISLGNGASTPCFDGTNFFAGSHTYGTGNNNLTYTSLVNDSTTHYLYALYFGNSVLKPLIWQNRAGPELRTIAGTEQSYESRQIRWWCDLRGGYGYGYWWNAIKMTITGTPSVIDMLLIFQLIDNAFRSFTLPVTQTNEKPEYIHEQTVFSDKNLYMMGSIKLQQVLRQSLGLPVVPQYLPGGQNVVSGNVQAQTVPTVNLYHQFARYGVSALLGT